MNLYNTLTRQKEQLPSPQDQKMIKLYSCGPTVYDETHIGHMRKYTMDDILVRTLKYLGYEVDHVMNITDVGHLTGDDDSGDDKLEKGAKKQGKTVWQIAEYYTEKFFETMDALGVERPEKIMKATENIEAMIHLIKQLEEKGYTYETDQAIYFDVTKFKTYGQLSGQKLEDKKQAVRDEVFADPKKRHPADFALWFRCVGRFANHTMHWTSPWGNGFPGWHIECSAMSMKTLGDSIDIHTGGIDHIPVHHENEIAQSEAATGKQFVKWWVHHAFLKVNGEKMSKSKGNFYTLKDLQERNIDPMAVRYLFLQTHYRQEMNFTWESLEAAQNALNRLKNFILFRKDLYLKSLHYKNDLNVNKVENEFINAVTDDLNTASAISIIFLKLVNLAFTEISEEQKLALLLKWDRILGLNLENILKEEIIKETTIFPAHIINLAEDRLEAKRNKNFPKADELRKKIEIEGYILEDTKEGYIIKKMK